MASVKFDFKKPFLSGAGKVIKDANPLNELLGSTLLNSNIERDKGIITKYFGWGKDLLTSGTLTLDKADKDTLSDFIWNSGLTVLMKGQISECMDEPVK